ncbi:hypothetical protein niasHT_012867 [Heterodera trifolii]|uniref:ISXO2-like transposase domain-containing protein n=1 Tax=Heterodera trifolii TaxID=157864 RepID=A0ABD2KYR4_9BILA
MSAAQLSILLSGASVAAQKSANPMKQLCLPSAHSINQRTFRSLFCIIAVNIGGYFILLFYVLLIKPAISCPITSWFGQQITAIPLNIGAASNGPILYFTRISAWLYLLVVCFEYFVVIVRLTQIFLESLLLDYLGAHLTPKQIFEFTYYWCRRTHSQEEFEHDMKIERHTIVDRKSFARDICVSYFQTNPEKIGANGQTVEIDETVITRPKYHKGRLHAIEQWFFGGIERGTGRCFMVPVERRNAETLLPILQKYVYPGAVIVSDLWKAYFTIGRLPEGYTHHTVNHSVEFVNSETGQHTNTVEGGLWQKFKAEHKKDMEHIEVY